LKWIRTGKLRGAVPSWRGRDAPSLSRRPGTVRARVPAPWSRHRCAARRPRLATMLRADAVLRSQVQKTSAYFSRYQVKYRRRREGKTDYRCVRRGARASGSAPGAAR
jgi:hypothetical protein